MIDPSGRTEVSAVGSACGSDEAAATVYFDGGCPLCAAEIGFYRRRRGAERIAWVDVSAVGDGTVVPDLTRDLALARFHVRDRTGRLVSGGAAFAALWSAMPGFAVLGAAFRGRLAVRVLDGLYDVFLRLRPRLQTLIRRRMPR